MYYILDKLHVETVTNLAKAVFAMAAFIRQFNIQFTNMQLCLQIWLCHIDVSD